MAEERYIIGDDTGWLRVRKTSGDEIPLPEFLKVEFLKSEKEPARREVRDHFKIIEGRERGTLASVRQKADGLSWLAKGNPGWQGPAQVRFSLSKSQVTYPGGPAVVAVSEGKPISVGIYDLEIPDAPHLMAAQYLDRSRRALTWFFIGHTMNNNRVNNRYLHTGLASAGCVTVKSLDRWEQLYRYLILSRKDDGLSVGTITVTL
jgi:hypothetical protein